MLQKKKYKYNGKEFIEVPSRDNVCDGCIFEFHEIGHDCMTISKPECSGDNREDGQNVIFRYKEVKPKPKKDGKANGAASRPRGRRGSKA